MLEYNLKDKCHINTNWDTDTFVGIKCDNGNFSIHFPLGYFKLSKIFFDRTPLGGGTNLKYHLDGFLHETA